MWHAITGSPQYKCGASLQTCSSVRNQRSGSSRPEDGAAPAWCCRAPQTPCRRRARAGAPCRSPWPPARPDTEPWPSPCQVRRWQCGSDAQASTQIQGRPGGGVLWLNVLSWVWDGNIWKDLPLDKKGQKYSWSLNCCFYMQYCFAHFPSRTFKVGKITLFLTVWQYHMWYNITLQLYDVYRVKLSHALDVLCFISHTLPEIQPIPTYETLKLPLVFKIKVWKFEPCLAAQPEFHYW